MSDRMPRPAPRDEFRGALRAQLLREAPSALLPRPRAALWWRPLAGAVATVALVVAANTAAAQSLPGEAPFVIKRTVEEARLLLAFDEGTRVGLLTDHAQERLVEVQRASARSQPAATVEASSGLAQALGRLADEVEAIKRAAAPVTDDQHRGNGKDAVGRAEEIAREQADAIEKLLPAAGSAKASLERAVEQTRKIRSTPVPGAPRAR